MICIHELHQKFCERSHASSGDSSMHMLTYNLISQYYGPPNGPPLNLPPGFMQDIYNVVCTFNVTASGRRRLAEGPELVFYAT